jgi:hypothetical protein
MEALSATVRTLAEADALPSPLDAEAAIPPTSRAWVRRVPGCNLWVFYRATDDMLTVILVTRSPPVPIR